MHRTIRTIVTLTTVAAAMSGSGMATPVDGQISVSLEHDTEGERATRAQLLRLLEEYDVSEWIYTDRVRIDETEIPHSHPVLTLHTRHLDEDEMLISTFVHEQFHWLEGGETLPAFEAAMADFATIFPDAPGREGGGARDQESTYRHLVVCDLEFQAMTRLVGEARARELLAGIGHYRWIYERVLTDPRIREVNERHGFVID